MNLQSQFFTANLKCTVGTKPKAYPGKCIQELNSDRVGFTGVVGDGFLVENKGKGQGVRGGVEGGTGKEPSSQCASFVETTL